MNKEKIMEFRAERVRRFEKRAKEITDCFEVLCRLAEALGADWDGPVRIETPFGWFVFHAEKTDR